MKILIHSNAPWAGSGYGQQAALFAKRFQNAGHDVAISTNWGLQGAGLSWEGIKVYPGDNAWGNRTLPIIAAHHGDGDPQNCLVVTILDVHVLKLSRLADLHIAAWCPVDHYPVPPKVHEFFTRTGAWPIAMCEFGVGALEHAGFDPLYVPHGIDTNVFRPRPDEGKEYREQMKIPADAFVIGMVARNQGTSPSRKAFPQVFAAFAQFHKAHPEAVLYLHTDMFGFEDGINLMVMAEAHGIPKDAITFTHQGNIELGLVDSDELARIYSSFDVLANPSLGEGFGIPIVEAQACGTPVIVTDHTSMPELCGSGWIVGGDLTYDPSQGAFWRVPSVQGIIDAFEDARQRTAGMGEAAREFALAYDADRVVAEHWTGVLAECEERMGKGREVKPFELVGRKPATVAA